MITVLSGGTGTPKLLQGLKEIVDPKDLTIIVNTLENDRKRISLGIATKSDMPKMANVIHHFSHHSGITTVINIEMPVNKTIRMERGMSACWMVLSTKLTLPCTNAPGIFGRLLIRL